ncbi:MAG: tRNA dihydrouridine synthase DusB [Planctomycetota bacterium]
MLLSAAPMAGISSPIYRLLCRKMGATLCFTEMISAKGLMLGNVQTRKYLSTAAGEAPVGAQFFGRDPDLLAAAAEKAAVSGFDLIDINMGCPVRKVVSVGSGVALMKEIPQACKIVRAVKDRVDLPVTAKIRSGWSSDTINAMDFARALEDSGLSAVTVHPRTRDQGYAGAADWALIGRVKEHVRIPVVGNGDVRDGPSARELRETTGCDGIMVGRAALGNPWIFRDALAALHDRPIPPPPDRKERFEVFCQHMEGLLEELGHERGSRSLKKFGAWYIRGFRGAPAARAALHESRSSEEIESIVRSVLLGP